MLTPTARSGRCTRDRLLGGALAAHDVGQMSREGRAGLGIGIVGMALIAIPPSADHFGYRLTDQAWAWLLGLGVVGLVLGCALVIHAAWPTWLRVRSPFEVRDTRDNWPVALRGGREFDVPLSSRRTVSQAGGDFNATGGQEGDARAPKSFGGRGGDI
jgi:hypothetical protein